MFDDVSAYWIMLDVGLGLVSEVNGTLPRQLARSLPSKQREECWDTGNFMTLLKAKSWSLATHSVTTCYKTESSCTRHHVWKKNIIFLHFLPLWGPERGLHHVRLACQSLSRVRIAPHSCNLGEVSTLSSNLRQEVSYQEFPEKICLQNFANTERSLKHLETAFKIL